jgi:hypothetical protein
MAIQIYHAPDRHHWTLRHLKTHAGSIAIVVSLWAIWLIERGCPRGHF